MSLTSFHLAGLVVGAATNSTAALRLPSDIVESTVRDRPALSWQTPATLAPLDPKQKERLLRAFDKPPQHRAVSAIIIGRFDYAGGGLLVKSSQGAYSYKAAFGHLNCCTGRIVVEQVE